MLLEQFLIHPRLVIKPFEVGFTHQLNEIVIAGEISGEQNEMIIVVMRQSAFAVLPVARRHVGFTADDGLHSTGQGFLVKFNGPKQVAMVRHGNGRHAEVFYLLDERLNLVRPIEQAVLRV